MEGGIRMPSFVRGPGIKPGSYLDVPVVQWDFLQTFYDLAGGTEPLPPELDGGSLKEVSEAGLNNECGLLVNSSRGIIYASAEKDFADKAREEALALQKQMKMYLKNFSSR